MAEGSGAAARSAAGLRGGLAALVAAGVAHPASVAAAAMSAIRRMATGRAVAAPEPHEGMGTEASTCVRLRTAGA